MNRNEAEYDLMNKIEMIKGEIDLIYEKSGISGIILLEMEIKERLSHYNLLVEERYKYG